ncbi:MAG: hypothetical protein JXA53_03355 [Bacteroidales bacterium]|nr:hypothetical protein [Bacteroidales bacterium]
MKNIFVVGLLFIFTSVLFGQQSENKVEQINAQKIAFFTEKLSLTAKEAQQFWPVYNDYWLRKNKLIEDRKNLMNYCSDNISNLSEKEIEEIADKYTRFYTEEANLLVKYNDKFKSVLPVKKVMKLYIADNQFKVYLLQQIRNANKK